MRWMVRLGLTAVLTMGMVFIGIRLVNFLMEWWYHPPTSGIKLRPTLPESEYSNETFGGTMRQPKEGEVSRLKQDYLENTIDSVTTVIERGGSLFYWVLLLTCIVLIGLIVTVSLRYNRHPSAEWTRGVTGPTTHRSNSRPSNRQQEPVWTGETVRDILIAFNLALPPTKKWMPSETVFEWAWRIGLTDIDFKPYLDVRYGVTVSVKPEEIARFREVLEQYQNQHNR